MVEWDRDSDDKYFVCVENKVCRLSDGHVALFARCTAWDKGLLVDDVLGDELG